MTGWGALEMTGWGVLGMTGRRGRFSFMKSACLLKIFGLRGFLFYLCSRIINYKPDSDMEVINKILMAVINFVIESIGFILIIYSFAILCLFTHNDRRKAAYTPRTCR